MDYRETYALWKEKLAGSPWYEELTALEQDEEALKNACWQWVEFGTAGMRGVIGPGPNQLNVFTVRRATQGLADYINSLGRAGDGVAIAYDSRRNSGLFARETALVLAANGVRAWLYPQYTSVPQLSFSILQLHCAAGVVITASHNPAKYNGYKLYGADGGQVANQVADAVLSYINAIDDPFAIQPLEEDQALAQGLLRYVGPELDDAYIEAVKAMCPERELLQQQGSQLSIVYTPLHGTGMRTVPRILKELGLSRLQVVAEQSGPDPDFPTVDAPNPEYSQAFDLARQLADREGAGLLLATDPDCDRLGLAVRLPDGDFALLNGNQTGCLLLDYLLSRTQTQPGDFAVRSLVSAPLADAICRHYGVEPRQVLTGFKYISEQIRQSLESGRGRFRFGFEESYGCLAGDYCRDKDAALAAMLAASAACWYAKQGLNLYQALQRLYQKYGYYSEQVLSFTREGTAGISAISRAVERLREQPPAALAGEEILAWRDYKTGRRLDAAGRESALAPPRANILYYELPQASLIVRPSGTEPKLKAYISVNAPQPDQAEAARERLVRAAQQLIQDLLA